MFDLPVVAVSAASGACGCYRPQAGCGCYRPLPNCSLSILVLYFSPFSPLIVIRMFSQTCRNCACQATMNVCAHTIPMYRRYRNLHHHCKVNTHTHEQMKINAYTNPYITFHTNAQTHTHTDIHKYYIFKHAHEHIHEFTHTRKAVAMSHANKRHTHTSTNTNKQTITQPYSAPLNPTRPHPMHAHNTPRHTISIIPNIRHARF